LNIGEDSPILPARVANQLARSRSLPYNKRHYSAKLQTTNQTLATSKHSIEFSYSDFPCHFKVNGDKLTLTNRRWMCKKRLKIDGYPDDLLGTKLRHQGKSPVRGPYCKKLDQSCAYD